MAHFELDEAFNDQAKIKVIGVGGAGGNAVNTMIASKVPGVEFIAANTDVQALERNHAPITLQLGRQVTRGLGAGANPERGREAALESVNEIGELLEGADMVFVTAGMGGGTGTGAAPIIAQVARECGALTVGVVTKPFRFEGRRRMKFAEMGIERLEQAVDTLITIPNDRLLQVTSANSTLMDAFCLADEVLQHATQGVSDLITIPGIINVDFADVRTIMSNQGRALMGMGVAGDEGRAVAAAQQAINSPLLEDVTIQGAKGILMNITSGPNLRLHEVEEAASLIMEAAHEDCNIIFGAVVDPNMGEALRITVIATGFDQHEPEEELLGNAIAAHAHRVRRQSQQMPMPGMGAQGSQSGMPVLGGSIQRKPKVKAQQPSLNPMFAGPARGGQPQPRGAQPQGQPMQQQQMQQQQMQQQQMQQPMAPQESGPYQQTRTPGMSGGWSRGDMNTVDPHEVPAFLRRRADSDGGGYVR
ncbi:cell division protein FtsZ [Pseudenhygromyxa sp. WMMC2535]|uniref:cell division protein FtsZ n=1 Tax=Pseudenhygromyxa sp. WMMC2535 TaxID=2712867 RepID=UPI0015524D7D|nr:cell division protein FtsZ [Pseudenhygromyxa sp. WMMC2535]NVB36502.1 cell division protein FtsZ [Pseudenhygromyxa sp. WMMC2535]